MSLRHDFNIAFSAHRRYRMVDQTLSEYRALEGAAVERIHHRLSQCRAPISPNQMCQKTLDTTARELFSWGAEAKKLIGAYDGQQPARVLQQHR
jgi:hypothetical protein